MKAHVVNGTVKRLISDTNERLFPPHMQSEFVSVPVGALVEVGDLWDGIAFSKPPAPLPTQADYEKAIQSMLDAKAKTRGYDGIVSACSYAGYANVFQAEAVAFGMWRSNVWAYCYQELAKVQAGTRTQPTIAGFITELEAAVQLVLP